MQCKNFNQLLLLCGFVLVTTITTSCFDADVADPPTPKTITDVVLLDPDLQLFEEAVARASLGSTLSGTGPFTLLVPDDDAFTASGINTSTVSAFTQSEAQAFVNYHILPGVTSFANFPGGPNSKVLTASGDSVFITKNLSGVYINGWKIVQPDLSVSNGLMHKIERVLTPPIGSIAETVQQTPNVFDSLAKAIQIAATAPGGDPTLATTLASNRVTVFAPTNQAFTTWMQSMSVTDINNIPIATLVSVLKYHITSDRVFSSDLSNGTLIMSGGGMATINLTNGMGGGPTITGTGNGGNSSNIITLNVSARNGVIHVIDRVLIP